jgi:thiamine kinase-like enzyme
MQDGPVTGLRRFGAEDELAVLLQWRERAALAEVAPPEGFEEACRELTATAPGLPQAPPVPCHRDLHDGQLLLTPHGVALLDFDLLCAGDAALDPANLLAHLHLRALQGEEGADENAAHACGEALLEGLDRSEEEGFSTRLRFYQATASLRLALVYGLRPRWAHLSATLVRLGRRALADARRGAAR